MQRDGIPLVVDLDGTLLKTNSLWESILGLLANNTTRIFCLVPLMLRDDRAGLKAACANYALPGIAVWPFNDVVLGNIASARQAGRKVFLATAAHIKIADAVAAHLRCFDGVLATQGEINLKGEIKAKKLHSIFGERGFDYIGNSRDDMPVWEICREAFVVNCSGNVRRKTDQASPSSSRVRCRHFIEPQNITPAVYMRAARVGQWLKNIMIAVPMLLSHKFSLPACGVILTAFFSFSLCASAFYIINDLLDLTSDRQHPTKKHRPFASGSLLPSHGIALACLLFLTSIFGSLLINFEFAAVVACYALLTLMYSKIFKAYLILDAVCLGILYTLRIAAGVAALQTDMSSWILGFSFFIFLGLAFIKRLVEIQRSADLYNLPGRAYRFSDGMVIECMAASSGFSAMIILALYINSMNAARLYTNPQFLWIVCPLILYWFCRLLILTHRDEMHDDPVAFVIKDKTSVICGIIGLIVILCAI
jgi:4-hydroxybenzoate polyprenyltransferase/phosphoserine phosphatase